MDNKELQELRQACERRQDKNITAQRVLMLFEQFDSQQKELEHQKEISRNFHCMSNKYLYEKEQLRNQLKEATEALTEIRALTDWAKNEHRQDTCKQVYDESDRALSHIQGKENEQNG